MHLGTGDCATIQSLLEQHLIDPNKKLADMSLLTFAATKGNICIMHALLKAGAKVNDADGKGGSAFSRVCRSRLFNSTNRREVTYA